MRNFQTEIFLYITGREVMEINISKYKNKIYCWKHHTWCIKNNCSYDRCGKNLAISLQRFITLCTLGCKFEHKNIIFIYILFFYKIQDQTAKALQMHKSFVSKWPNRNVGVKLWLSCNRSRIWLKLFYILPEIYQTMWSLVYKLYFTPYTYMNRCLILCKLQLLIIL